MSSCHIKIFRNYLSDMLNLEIDKLSIWFKANKLSLNLKKKLNFWSLNQDRNVQFVIFK